MRKFFKRDCALGIMMLGACALGLTACSSSDDDDSNGGGSVPGGNKSELVQQGKMLLTQIEVTEVGMGSMTYVDKYYYRYDSQLRFVSGSHHEDEDSTYDFFRMDWQNSKAYLDDEMPYYDVRFNADGYLTELSYGSIMKYKFSYDAAGHLVSQDLTVYLEDNETLTAKSTLTWDGGNLVKTYAESVWTNEKGVVTARSSSENTLTYGNQPNKYGQYPGIFAVGDDVDGLGGVGLFGKFSANLPTSIVIVDTDEYGGHSSTNTTRRTATFTLNSAGAIDTEEWVHVEDKNPSFTTTYKFSYSPTEGYTPSSAQGRPTSAVAKRLSPRKERLQRLRRAAMCSVLLHAHK